MLGICSIYLKTCILCFLQCFCLWYFYVFLAFGFNFGWAFEQSLLAGLFVVFSVLASKRCLLGGSHLNLLIIFFYSALIVAEIGYKLRLWPISLKVIWQNSFLRWLWSLSYMSYSIWFGSLNIWVFRLDLLAFLCGGSLAFCTVAIVVVQDRNRLFIFLLLSKFYFTSFSAFSLNTASIVLWSFLVEIRLIFGSFCVQATADVSVVWFGKVWSAFYTYVRFNRSKRELSMQSLRRRWHSFPWFYLNSWIIGG